MKRLSETGVLMIKHFEKCRLTAYLNDKGLWAIGWGCTRYENGMRVKRTDKIPQWRANELFDAMKMQLEEIVDALTDTVHLEQHQFDALVSLAWDIGCGTDAEHIVEGLRESRLLQKVLANPLDETIADEFLKWVYKDGVMENELLKRRRSEARLYQYGNTDFMSH